MSGEFKNAAVSFEMDGKSYALVLPAESFEDAERRMRAIRLTGKVDGWPCYTIKAPGPLIHLILPLVAAGVAFLNLFRRGSK